MLMLFMETKPAGFVEVDVVFPRCVRAVVGGWGVIRCPIASDRYAHLVVCLGSATGSVRIFPAVELVEVRPVCVFDCGLFVEIVVIYNRPVGSDDSRGSRYRHFFGNRFFSICGNRRNREFTSLSFGSLR